MYMHVDLGLDVEYLAEFSDLTTLNDAARNILIGLSIATVTIYYAITVHTYVYCMLHVCSTLLSMYRFFFTNFHT